MLGQGTVAVVHFACMLFLARLLTPTEIGVYAVALATSVLLGILSTSGAAAYIVRESELPRDKIDTAFTINAALSIGLASITALAAIPIGRFVGNAAVGEVLHWLALRPLLGLLEFRPAALLQREMNFRLPALVSIAAAIVNVAVTLIAAIHGESFFSLAYGTVSGGACSAVMLNLFASRHVSFRTSIAFWRPVLIFGIRMITVSGTPMLAQRVSEIIMGRLLGIAAVGLFTRATQISDLLFQNIYGTFTRVVFARLAKDQREHGSLTGSFLWGVEVITAVMWPILLSVAVLSAPLIHFLYGAQWISAALPLSLLMLAQFMATLFAMNWELFVIRNETAKQTRFEVSRAIASVGVFTLGCLVSMAAAAAGRIVDSLVGLIIYRPHIRRLTSVPEGAIARVYQRSALMAFAATLPAIILMITTGWSVEIGPGPMFASLILGAIIWLAIVVFSHHPVWRFIRGH